jgi:ribosome-binding protein aMBF1 (putative translation factor)
MRSETERKKMDNKYNGGAMTNKNDLSSALCDAYDIKDRLRAYGIKDKPKDADGSETTIGDCIDDIIHFLKQLEK